MRRRRLRKARTFWKREEHRQCKDLRALVKHQGATRPAMYLESEGNGVEDMRRWSLGETGRPPGGQGQWESRGGGSRTGLHQ